MKSHPLIKFFTLTMVVGCTFFPLEAKAQTTYSNSQYNSNAILEYTAKRRAENEQLQREIREMKDQRIIDSLTY